MTPEPSGESLYDPALRGNVDARRVRDPSKWWRPDGTRPDVGESAEGLIVHDPQHHDDNGQLKAVSAFSAAIEAGDHSNLDELAAAAEKAERDQERRAAQRVVRDEKRRAKREAQATAINKLVEDGWDPDEAESAVVGDPVDWIRKRNFMAARPGWDGTVSGFEKAVREDWLDNVERLYVQAEEATGGQMVKRKYVLRIDPISLWLTDSDNVVEKYASDELAEWFNLNPNSRPTFSDFRSQVLDGRTKYRRRDDYRQ